MFFPVKGERAMQTTMALQQVVLTNIYNQNQGVDWELGELIGKALLLSSGAQQPQ
jgi:hypothetical protein